MKKRIEVVAAVIRNNDKYLCAQRKDYGELAKKWEFPGGKIELGESNEEALIREIKEELDITISVQAFLTTVNHEYESFHITMHAYLCEITEGNLTILDHIDAKWLTVTEMIEYDFAAADHPIISKLNNIKDIVSY